MKTYNIYVNTAQKFNSADYLLVGKVYANNLTEAKNKAEEARERDKNMGGVYWKFPMSNDYRSLHIELDGKSRGILVTKHDETGYEWVIDVCDNIDNQETLEKNLSAINAEFFVEKNGDLYIIAEDEEDAKGILTIADNKAAEE